jgi:hypothetical protein
MLTGEAAVDQGGGKRACYDAPMPCAGGRPTPVLALLALGLLLIPVQCAKGLHSIFVAASSPAGAAAVEAHRRHAEHAAHDAGSNSSHKGGTVDGSTAPVQPKPRTPLVPASSVRSAIPERSSPAPVRSAMADHPYTIALSRAVSTVGPPITHVAPLMSAPLAPDAIVVAPEPPPPRDRR